MASIEETETKRDIRTRLKRKPFAGIGEADVVGYFPHQIVPSHVTIREHKVDSRIVYSVKTEPKSDCVVELGTEMSSLDNGFDYAVVAVNKNTGETQWRPAKMFKFEGRFGDNPESIIGIKRPDAVDYSANNTITMDSWAMKRHQLTESFGSSMKKKIQDAAYRRSVNESVLDEMVKTSFASDTVIKGKTEAKLEDITLVQHADSSILPPAVQAELPKDIYPVEMFVSPEDAEQMREKAEWRIKMPKAELLESGWSDIVFKSCPDYFSYYGAKAVGFELLAFQVYVLGKMSKNKSIVMSDMDNAPFDLAVVQKVQVEYMPKEVDRGVSGKAIRRMIFSSEEKQRLAAYTLALALTLSPGCALPVSLWEGALGMPPKQCEKLLIALGCSLSFCSMEESLRTGSLQSARLLRPPELNKKTPRKIRR